MKTKGFFVLCAALLCLLPATAQTQQGYVKTKGQLQADGSIKPGVRLENVVIGIGSNGSEVRSVLSRQRGEFTFNVPGTRFYLSKVVKKGYVLADPEARRIAYQPTSLPLIIVMEDSLARQMEMTSAIKKIRRTMTAEFQRREDEIEARLDKSEQEKQQLLNQLYDQQSNAEKLISEMAERFVGTDYDQVSDLNRRINAFIMEGELLKADSLIATKGSFEEREREIQAEREAKEHARLAKEAAAKAEADLERDLSFKVNDLADDYYNKYTMYASRLMADSAVYFLSRRVALDDTNMQWLQDAAVYCHRQKLFPEARTYYDKLLPLCQQQAADDPETYEPVLARIQSNIGMLYYELQQYDESERLSVAATTTLQRLGERDPETYLSDYATAANNLANVYFHKQLLAESENIQLAILAARRQTGNAGDEVSQANIAQSLTNLGNLYAKERRFDEAEQLYTEAVAIYEHLAGNDPDTYEPTLASVQNNLGCLYRDMQKTNLSEQHLLAALAIRNRLAEDNPRIYGTELAMTMDNLGSVYAIMKQYDKCEKLLSAALDLSRHFATLNPQAYTHLVASTEHNLAMLYRMTNRLDESRQMFLAALTTRQQLAAEQPMVYNADLAGTYTELGSLYRTTQQYDECEQAYLAAYELYRQLAADNPKAFTALMSKTTFNLALLYNTIGRLDDCDTYLQSSLDLFEQEAATNPKDFTPMVAAAHVAKGGLLLMRQRYGEGIGELATALALYRKLYSDDPTNKDTKDAYTQLLQNLSQLYTATGKPDEAAKLNTEFARIKESGE